MTAIISEQEETRRGELLVEVLHLKRSKTERGRYDTTWGTKWPFINSPHREKASRP